VRSSAPGSLACAGVLPAARGSALAVNLAADPLPRLALAPPTRKHVADVRFFRRARLAFYLPPPDGLVLKPRRGRSARIYVLTPPRCSRALVSSASHQSGPVSRVPFTVSHRARRPVPGPLLVGRAALPTVLAPSRPAMSGAVLRTLAGKRIFRVSPDPRRPSPSSERLRCAGLHHRSDRRAQFAAAPRTSVPPESRGCAARRRCASPPAGACAAPRSGATKGGAAQQPSPAFAPVSCGLTVVPSRQRRAPQGRGGIATPVRR